MDKDQIKDVVWGTGGFRIAFAAHKCEDERAVLQGCMMSSGAYNSIALFAGISFILFIFFLVEHLLTYCTYLSKLPVLFESFIKGFIEMCFRFHGVNKFI